MSTVTSFLQTNGPKFIDVSRSVFTLKYVARVQQILELAVFLYRFATEMTLMWLINYAFKIYMSEQPWHKD